MLALWHDFTTRPTSKPSPFLQIPLEIRQEVYAFVRLQSPNIRPCGHVLLEDRVWRSLSLTCRQIREEFLPFMMNVKYYKRGLIQFLRWVERGSPHMTCHIQELDLHFWTSCCDTLMPSAQGSMSQKSLTTAVDGDTVLGLQKALPLFQAVNHLSLYSFFSSHHDGERKLLDVLSSAMSGAKITTFDVHSVMFSMPSLQHFPYLKHLKLGNRTLSTPDETLTVLQSMKFLVTIELHGPVSFEENLEETYISFTSDVLAKISPLTGFGISGFVIHPPGSGGYPESLRPMIVSLHAHIPSLRKVSIDLRGINTSEGFMREILHFVASAQLNNVSIIVRVSKRFVELDDLSFFPIATKGRMVVESFVEYQPFHLCKGYGELTIGWRSEVMPEGCDDRLELNKHVGGGRAMPSILLEPDKSATGRD